MKKIVFYAFFTLCSLQLSAQQQQSVSGIVTDASDGSVLPGVSIVIQGTSTGVTTDFDGKYFIEVPSGEIFLEFSSLGFKNHVILVGKEAVVNIALEQDSNQLNEIVVIGYGSVKKKDLTGAIISLGGEEMTTGAGVNSAAQMIQGRAAGVEVSANDGEPGKGMNIIIRGSTSISNSNEPLYVVDGFPIAAGVSIAPDDIETIVILKDAASAAIYGSRGSAGVVLITTKRGKTGKTEISFDAYTGITSMTGSVDYLSWEENSRIVNEQNAQGPNDGNPWYNAADLASPYDTDWLDEATRQAQIQNYTLRASGGDEKSHFSISGNLFNQEGLFLNSEFNRASIRLNADRKFGEKTKVGMNIYVSTIDSDALDKRAGARNTSPLFAILRASPGRAAYNDDGTLAQTALSRDTRPFKNPIGFLTKRTNELKEWRVYSNLFIDHNITENLTARLNAGFDHSSGTTGQYQPLEYVASGTEPIASIAENKFTTYLIEGTLNYNVSLDGGHVLNILGGASTQSDEFFSFSSRGTGFPTDKTLYYNLGSANNQFVDSYKEETKLISFFGRANYNYNGKYIFVATLRADGASQFGENNKWGYFPSVSAAWRLVEEDFMNDLDLFSDLKLRVSYGLTGNNGISPYTSLARVGATQTVTLDGSTSSSGLGSDGVYAPNPDLKWETTAMFNFGLDFGFWDNRLFGSFEVYISDTDDLIIDKPISGASTGFSTIVANVGSMKNNGVELSLGGKIIEGDKFKWTANANFSKNTNEITELDGDNPIILGVARQPYGEIGEQPYRQLVTGGKIGDFFGYTYKGVLQAGEVYTPQPLTTQAGSALYEDINNDGIINADDRSVIGNANPDFIWGFTNHFEFGGLYLDMFWQGVVGNDIFNFKAINSDRFLSEKALDRYSPTNTNGTRPGIDYFANTYGSYVNTEFIEGGTYARLKNLAIGYNVNTDKIKWLSGLSVYAQGQNLITITDYTGFDPEVSFDYSGSQNSVNRGVDDYGYPNYKTYTLGLKVNF